MKKKWIKAILVMIVCLVLIYLIDFANIFHFGYETEYVEHFGDAENIVCGREDVIEQEFMAETGYLNAIEVFLVNLPDDRSGQLQVQLFNQSGKEIKKVKIDISNIDVATWYKISMNTSVKIGQSYKLIFTNIDCNIDPYFMAVGEQNHEGALTYNSEIKPNKLVVAYGYSKTIHWVIKFFISLILFIAFDATSKFLISKLIHTVAWKLLRFGEKYKEKIIIYTINVGCILAVYALFLNFSFTSDFISVATVEKGIDAGTNFKFSLSGFCESIPGGRMAAYFFFYIYSFLQRFGVNKLSQRQWVMQLIAIMIYAVSSTIIYQKISQKLKYEKYNFFLNVIIMFGFTNPFIVESYVYVAIDWAFEVLFAVIAAVLIDKKRYILSCIMAFVAVSCYQSMILIYCIYAILFIYIENEHKFSLEVIKQYFYVGLNAGIAVALNLTIVKLYIAYNNKMVSIQDTIPNGSKEVLTEVKQTALNTDVPNLWNTLVEQYKMIIIDSYRMLPKWSLLAVIFVITFMACIQLIRRKEFMNCVYMLAVIVILHIMNFTICIIMVGVWLPQRVTFVSFMATSAILIIGYSVIKDFVLTSALQAIVLVFMGINIFFTETCILDFYTTNTLDKQYIYMIQDEINEYEAKSGIQIQNIAVGKIKNHEYNYEEFSRIKGYEIPNYNHKTVYDRWSDVMLLNYFTGRDYQVLRLEPSERREVFDERQWKVFNASEQLVFEGSTMYWAIY